MAGRRHPTLVGRDITGWMVADASAPIHCPPCSWHDRAHLYSLIPLPLDLNLMERIKKGMRERFGLATRSARCGDCGGPVEFERPFGSIVVREPLPTDHPDLRSACGLPPSGGPGR